jgi:hypothetical protein
MITGSLNDPVSSGILVEMDGKSPILGPPMPDLNMAAYFLVSVKEYIFSHQMDLSTPLAVLRISWSKLFFCFLHVFCRLLCQDSLHF